MSSGGVFDVAARLKRAAELETEIAGPDFWGNQDRANDIIKELKTLKSLLDPFLKVEKGLRELVELIDIVEEDDIKSVEHLRLEMAKWKKTLNGLEFKSMMSGRMDRNNAIVSINAGAGGTESCDWAGMLYRMYTKWAEPRGYGLERLDFLQGEEAGVKNVMFMVKGDFAYGYLRSESGVHRLVRISPFDSNKRRHTSFASVDVIPEVTDEIKIDVKGDDLKIDTFRSGGKGGQHVNKTESAIRITHIPSGIVVQCQNERSQFKNKTAAMKILKAKLYEVEESKKISASQTAYDSKKEIAWGSQIRSYVLHPYSLVKDHRTDYETSNVQGVLNGELDEFMQKYLKTHNP